MGQDWWIIPANQCQEKWKLLEVCLLLFVCSSDHSKSFPWNRHHLFLYISCSCTSVLIKWSNTQEQPGPLVFGCVVSKVCIFLPAALELKADQLQYTLRGIILILFVALTLVSPFPSLCLIHNDNGNRYNDTVRTNSVQIWNSDKPQTFRASFILRPCQVPVLLWLYCFTVTIKEWTILQKILCSQLIYGSSFSLQGSALPWSNEAEDNLKSIAAHSTIERTAPKEDSSH